MLYPSSFLTIQYMNLYKKIALTVATLALSSASSSAALLLTFTEEGGNVVMRTSGSVDMNGTWNADSERFAPGGGVMDQYGFYNQIEGDYEYFRNIDGDEHTTDFALQSTGQFLADSSVGDHFLVTTQSVAFFNDQGAVNDNAAPTGAAAVYNPATVITWNNTSINALFGSAHDRYTEISLWQNDTIAGADGNISFALMAPAAAAVPEPSSTALLGLGGLGLLLRRRR